MKAYTVLTAILLGACASGNAAPKPVTWTKDPDLAPVLTSPELGRAQMAKVDTLASILPDFDNRLAAAVIDTTNPPLVRSNAILLIADRRAGGKIEAFLSALEAKDEAVRAAAVVGLRNYLGTWTSTVDLIKLALHDPSPFVQARALESIADREPDILREYLARTKNAELRAIAGELIAAAESRGASLIPVDTLGTLRVERDEIVLTYTPTKRWPNWSASLGTLTLKVGKGNPFTLSDSVEVVRNVLPAFISGDGRYIVYESNRHIYVRDVATNTTRLVGPGIAPRILPFSNFFVFAREKSRLDNPQGAGISYDMFRAPFVEGELAPIGMTGTHAQMQAAGNYSPMRWARIIEQDGKFVLIGESLNAFQLPDPFASSASR